MTTAAANALARHIFNNEPWAGVGDATGLPGSAIAGAFYPSLHSAAPGAAATQATNELAYVGYGNRPAVPRSTAGWTVGTGGAVSNAAIVTFGECESGTATGAYMGLGVATSGATALITYGQVISPAGGLPISPTITPRFPIGSL